MTQTTQIPLDYLKPFSPLVLGDLGSSAFLPTRNVHLGGSRKAGSVRMGLSGLTSMQQVAGRLLVAGA